MGHFPDLTNPSAQQTRTSLHFDISKLNRISHAKCATLLHEDDGYSDNSMFQKASQWVKIAVQKSACAHRIRQMSDFVLEHWNCLAMSESENIDFTSLVKWSRHLNDKLCSSMNRTNSALALSTLLRCSSFSSSAAIAAAVWPNPKDSNLEEDLAKDEAPILLLAFEVPLGHRMLHHGLHWRIPRTVCKSHSISVFAGREYYDKTIFVRRLLPVQNPRLSKKEKEKHKGAFAFFFGDWTPPSAVSSDSLTIGRHTKWKTNTTISIESDGR